MTRYVVDFERVGRGYGVGPMTFDAAGSDDLARQVHGHIRPLLASRHFDVTVDLEEGRGWIEDGRFGTFTITPT